MAPAKPLPMEVPDTSTYWPSTKWSAVISAPTSIKLSGLDAELGELALGLDIGHGEMPARGARKALHLGPAGAELERGVAVLLRRAVADDLAMLKPQHRHRDVLPGIGEDPGHADLLRDDT